MLESLGLWLMTIASGLVASTVTTITGVGAGLIVYGTLGLFFDLKLLIPLTAPAQLFSGALRLWVFRRAIRWSMAWRFFLGVTPGIYGGTLLFQVLSELVLRRVLGVFLLGFAAWEYCRTPAQHPAPHSLWLPVSGFLAGILLGSVGVPGPFLAVVFLRYGLLKEDLVAMIALFFLIGNAQRTLLYWSQETLTRQHLDIAIILGIAMVVGVYVGRVLLPYISREMFVRLVLGMLVIFGGQFLFW